MALSEQTVVLGDSIGAPGLGMAGLPLQHTQTDWYCRER